MAINSIPGTIAPSAQKKAPDSLSQAQALALQGIRNQDYRFQIITENLTNSDTTASVPGGDPYRRKEVVFAAKNDPRTGMITTQVKGVAGDKTQFEKDYDPGHPAADKDGMVKKPNINRVRETVDMIKTKHTQQTLLKLYTEGTSMRRLQIDLMR